MTPHTVLVIKTLHHSDVSQCPHMCYATLLGQAHLITSRPPSLKRMQVGGYYSYMNLAKDWLKKLIIDRKVRISSSNNFKKEWRKHRKTVSTCMTVHGFWEGRKQSNLEEAFVPQKCVRFCGFYISRDDMNKIMKFGARVPKTYAGGVKSSLPGLTCTHYNRCAINSNTTRYCKPQPSLFPPETTPL